MADANARLKMMREDLQTQITDVYATSGTVLIVHPKNDVKFNAEYCDWLAENLKEILPYGVRAMVLAENVTQFDVVRPASDSLEYRMGWNDALKAISESL